MFEVRSAGVRYGARRALERVDLRIDRGERVALIGPTGAGKTSPISLLSGNLAPAEGQVLVLGKELARATPRERRPFSTALAPSARSSTSWASCGWSTTSTPASSRADRSGAPGCRCSPRARSSGPQCARASTARGEGYERTEGVSGGRQHRVAIARVLAQEHGTIRADEPIASVDPARAAQIVELMLSLSSRTAPRSS